VNDDTSLLKKLIEEHLPKDEQEIDPKTIRWALYARKSTESIERQARSIPDQIADCHDAILQPLGIVLSKKDIYTEERSAKEADTRPVFRDVINAIKDSKYDGLIAWHPDRLARNMKEAGEIIDLIDKGVIKDLKFARSHFENTPSGKMTLGISFVLSKHYSEHLSESVNRGNRRITERGGILYKFKHGYRIQDTHKLIADDDNYLLIQKAFEMRTKNKTQKEIAEFLNKSSYKVYRRSKGHQDYTFDEDAISKMLRDPVYAGVIIYGNHVGLVADYDPTFTPMLTEQEFLNLHGEKNFLSKSFRASTSSQPRDNSNFLRRFVKCGHCGRFMTTSVSKSGSTKQHYFYFRCENKGGCVVAGTGPRGVIALDYAINFLDNHRFVTEENYNRYKIDVEERLKFDTEENDRIIGQATSLLGKRRKEFENAKKPQPIRATNSISSTQPETSRSLKMKLIHSTKNSKKPEEKKLSKMKLC